MPRPCLRRSDQRPGARRALFEGGGEDCEEEVGQGHADADEAEHERCGEPVGFGECPGEDGRAEVGGGAGRCTEEGGHEAVAEGSRR